MRGKGKNKVKLQAARDDKGGYFILLPPIRIEWGMTGYIPEPITK